MQSSIRSSRLLASLLASAGATIALLASASAYAETADFHGQARLAAPAAAPAAAKINGVDWTCAGDSCQAEGVRASRLDSFVRECRKVSAAFGPLSSYASQGRTMSPGDLEACNRLAQGAAGRTAEGK